MRSLVLLVGAVVLFLLWQGFMVRAPSRAATITQSIHGRFSATITDALPTPNYVLLEQIFPPDLALTTITATSYADGGILTNLTEFDSGHFCWG